MNKQPDNKFLLGRRKFLMFFSAMLAGVIPAMLTPYQALASPSEARKRLAELTRSISLIKDKVTISLPKITYQPSFIPLKISVKSPMTAQDYVKVIHVVAERNPEPVIASYHFTPDSGKAELSTRIQLTRSQVVIAAAEMSDGSMYYAKTHIRISDGSSGCG